MVSPGALAHISHYQASLLIGGTLPWVPSADRSACCIPATTKATTTMNFQSSPLPPFEPLSYRSSETMPQPKPRKVGRPKLPKGDAKGRIVPIRFNTQDIKRIEAAAKVNKQSVSEWIRRTVNAAVKAFPRPG